MPSTAAFACPLHGLAFGPFTDGRDPSLGAAINRRELRREFEKIEGAAGWVRTYGTTGGLGAAGGIAHSLGFSTAIAAWLDSDEASNEAEITRLIRLARRGHVDLAIVGSEVLVRGDLPLETLIDYIRRVRQALPSRIPVATAAVHTTWLAHPELINEADVVIAHIYPFFDGAPIRSAIASLHGDFLRLQEAVGGAKPIMIGETGWPSAGEPIGEAVPSRRNAARYLMNFVTWAEAEGVDYFYFEALDEPWKARLEGERGAHWGVFNRHGVLKRGMARTFNCQRTRDNWTDRVVGPGPDPGIDLTFLPPIGSRRDLVGRVADVDPTEHAVAVYIRVRGRWWTKPFFNAPAVRIRSDGGWIADITTGGIDEQATHVATFLVPADYVPPERAGHGTLPEEIFDVAMDHMQVPRGRRIGRGRILNGSFESSEFDPGDGFRTLGAGSTGIDQWVVSGGSVDHVGGYWQAGHKRNSIDLNGGSAGSIEQAFYAVRGRRYRVEFLVSGNPEGEPADKLLSVKAGDAGKTFEFPISGRSTSDMGWTLNSFAFAAERSAATLTFTSLVPGAFGPALDNIRLIELDKP